MLATYHNHSRWSDGKASIPDLIASAHAQSISTLGISDHYCLHPAGVQQPWAMPSEKIDDYIRELQSARASTPPGLTLSIGVEADWFSNHTHVLKPALERLPVDYILGSIHFVGSFTIDGRPEQWAKLTDDQREQLHRDYWTQVPLMAQSRLFDIASHLDLAKKFGYFAKSDLTSLINPALDALADNHLVVELNTAGWHKPCNDAYPSLDILRACRNRNIPVTISADAHQPEHLLRDFDKAALRLHQAGYDRVARFHNREVTFDSLADAVPKPSHTTSFAW
ncbi:MAG TPA: histidinol-phosphatase HisJ family protein [Phycisphaerales bacterium]|nr:histidinol-phosphatase HisJ family protein [Phycisphaerales bacterium]